MTDVGQQPWQKLDSQVVYSTGSIRRAKGEWMSALQDMNHYMMPEAGRKQQTRQTHRLTLAKAGWPVSSPIHPNHLTTSSCWEDHIFRSWLLTYSTYFFHLLTQFPSKQIFLVYLVSFLSSSTFTNNLLLLFPLLSPVTFHHDFWGMLCYVVPA